MANENLNRKKGGERDTDLERGMGQSGGVRNAENQKQGNQRRERR